MEANYSKTYISGIGRSIARQTISPQLCDDVKQGNSKLPNRTDCNGKSRTLSEEFDSRSFETRSAIMFLTGNNKPSSRIPTTRTRLDNIDLIELSPVTKSILEIHGIKYMDKPL